MKFRFLTVMILALAVLLSAVALAGVDVTRYSTGMQVSTYPISGCDTLNWSCDLTNAVFGSYCPGYFKITDKNGTVLVYYSSQGTNSGSINIDAGKTPYMTYVRGGKIENGPSGTASDRLITTP